jgi:hypothetical protein
VAGLPPMHVLLENRRLPDRALDLRSEWSVPGQDEMETSEFLTLNQDVRDGHNMLGVFLWRETANICDHKVIRLQPKRFPVAAVLDPRSRDTGGNNPAVHDRDPAGIQVVFSNQEVL